AADASVSSHALRLTVGARVGGTSASPKLSHDYYGLMDDIGVWQVGAVCARRVGARRGSLRPARGASRALAAHIARIIRLLWRLTRKLRAFNSTPDAASRCRRSPCSTLTGCRSKKA